MGNFISFGIRMGCGMAKLTPVGMGSGFEWDIS